MITDEEIEQLPEHSEDAFVEFERIVWQRTNNKINESAQEQWGNCDVYYLEYINEVSAAAREFDIEPLKSQLVPQVSDANLYQAYLQFTHEVDGFTTQIRLRRLKRNRRNSVGLDGNTKTRIHQYIQKIRTVLN